MPSTTSKKAPSNLLAVLKMGEEGGCQFKHHLASSTNFSTQQRLFCFHLPVGKFTNPFPAHF